MLNATLCLSEKHLHRFKCFSSVRQLSTLQYTVTFISSCTSNRVTTRNMGPVGTIYTDRGNSKLSNVVVNNIFIYGDMT